MSLMIFLMGVCMGSFVNMLVFRTMFEKQIPRTNNQETNRKRSFCDFCGKQLNWWNNVPVLSFLFQKGKSQCCHKKLDVSYPIVEIITGLLFLLNFQFSIFNFQSIFNFEFLILNLITVLVIYSAVYDAKTMYLPDWSTYTLIFLAIIYQIIGRPVGPPMLYLLNIVYAAIGASGFLLLLYLITKGKGMGLGDVYLALFMGLLLGWPKIILAFYIAFIVGAIWGIILLILKRKKIKSEVPFGPFLLFGTMVVWYFGDKIMYYVLSIM